MGASSTRANVELCLAALRAALAAQDFRAREDPLAAAAEAFRAQDDRNGGTS